MTRPYDRIIKNILALLCVCNNDNGFIDVSLNSANTDQTAVMSSPVWISITTTKCYVYETETAFGKISLMVMTGVSKCLGQICNDKQMNILK